MASNLVDALKAVIAAGDWDTAGLLADEHVFVDCLRCFSAPRRLLSCEEPLDVYMCLFCASCWYTHEKHKSMQRRRVLAECEICDVVGAHRSVEQVLVLRDLRSLERHYLRTFGWTRDGEYWIPPANQRFKYTSGYTHDHAVNALKQRHRNDKQPRQQRNLQWRKDDD